MCPRTEVRFAVFEIKYESFSRHDLGIVDLVSEVIYLVRSENYGENGGFGTYKSQHGRKGTLGRKVLIFVLNQIESIEAVYKFGGS